MSFVASSLLYASFFVRFREPMAICEAEFADSQNTIVRLFFLTLTMGHPNQKLEGSRGWS